jgi:hypothetical protein
MGLHQNYQVTEVKENKFLASTLLFLKVITLFPLSESSSHINKKIILMPLFLNVACYICLNMANEVLLNIFR